MIGATCYYGLPRVSIGRVVILSEAQAQSKDLSVGRLGSMGNMSSLRNLVNYSFLKLLKLLKLPKFPKLHILPILPSTHAERAMKAFSLPGATFGYPVFGYPDVAARYSRW